MLNIPATRLYNQQIISTRLTTPAEVVAWLGALQAQDYAGAKWSIGLRLPGSTDAAIEQAIADKTIIRTWPLRGTLHFAAAADIRWMLKLCAPGIIARKAPRWRELELDDATFVKSGKLIAKALRGSRQLTREELFAVLERAKISTAGQRGYHILLRNALEGLICFGTQRGKQHTFVLLDEWVPPAKTFDRDRSLAELARRYFVSRGPATVRDFIWWSGLNAADARSGIASVESELTRSAEKGETFWMPRTPPNIRSAAASVQLLPGFDEYLLGYTDRSAVSEPHCAQKLCPGGNGMFIPTIIIGGHVAGTWTRIFRKNSVGVTPNPFKKLTTAQTRALAAATRRYAAFLSLSSAN